MCYQETLSWLRIKKDQDNRYRTFLIHIMLKGRIWCDVDFNLIFAKNIIVHMPNAIVTQSLLKTQKD